MTEGIKEIVCWVWFFSAMIAITLDYFHERDKADKRNAKQ